MGHSSAGRALAWHARGQRFDPAWLHQISRFAQFLKNVHVPDLASYLSVLSFARLFTQFGYGSFIEAIVSDMLNEEDC